MQKNLSKERIRKLTLGALMTALVIVLQLIGTYTTFFGPFSTAVALPAIVIGTVLCGWAIGAWLGLVFGVVVLFTNSQLFLAFSVPGTIVTVLVKGIACGLIPGLVYMLLKKLLQSKPIDTPAKSALQIVTNALRRYVPTVVTAALCPVVNTAVFLLGSRLFFMQHSAKIAENLGLTLTGMELFYALAFGNFLIEILFTTILSPVIIRIVEIGQNMLKGSKKS